MRRGWLTLAPPLAVGLYWYCSLFLFSTAYSPHWWTYIKALFVEVVRIIFCGLLTVIN
jgi:hypothetical protein